MHISAPVDFTFRGAPARMHTVRNDGFCWGVIATDASPNTFDVHSEADLYDEADADACNAFIELAAIDANVTPSYRPFFN